MKWSAILKFRGVKARTRLIESHQNVEIQRFDLQSPKHRVAHERLLRLRQLLISESQNVPMYFGPPESNAGKPLEMWLE
jgi:hypothetical protein